MPIDFEYQILPNKDSLPKFNLLNEMQLGFTFWFDGIIPVRLRDMVHYIDRRNGYSEMCIMTTDRIAIPYWQTSLQQHRSPGTFDILYPDALNRTIAGQLASWWNDRKAQFEDLSEGEVAPESTALVVIDYANEPRAHTYFSETMVDMLRHAYDCATTVIFANAAWERLWKCEIFIDSFDYCFIWPTGRKALETAYFDYFENAKAVTKIHKEIVDRHSSPFRPYVCILVGENRAAAQEMDLRLLEFKLPHGRFEQSRDDYDESI